MALPSLQGEGQGWGLYYSFFTISKVHHLGQPTSNGDYRPVYYRLLVITLSLFGFHQVPIVGGLPLIFAPNRQKKGVIFGGLDYKTNIPLT